MTVITETGKAGAVTAAAVVVEMSPLTEMRKALWDVLEADSQIVAFFGGGHIYDADDGRYPPDELTPHDMPCIYTTGSKEGEQWASEATQLIAYNIGIRGHVVGTSQEPAERLYWTVHQGVMQQWPDLNGKLRIRGLTFGPPAIRPVRPRLGRIESWTVDFVIRVICREPIMGALYKLKFGSQLIGDECEMVRINSRKLVAFEQGLLGSPTGYIEESSPNWIWEIATRVYTKQTSIHTLNDFLVTTKQYFDGAGLQTLYVRNAGDSATIRTYTNCRLDGMNAPSGPDIPFNRYANVNLSFKTSSDPASS